MLTGVLLTGVLLEGVAELEGEGVTTGETPMGDEVEEAAWLLDSTGTLLLLLATGAGEEVTGTGAGVLVVFLPGQLVTSGPQEVTVKSSVL